MAAANNLAICLYGQARPRQTFPALEALHEAPQTVIANARVSSATCDIGHRTSDIGLSLTAGTKRMPLFSVKPTHLDAGLIRPQTTVQTQKNRPSDLGIAEASQQRRICSKRKSLSAPVARHQQAGARLQTRQAGSLQNASFSQCPTTESSSLQLLLKPREPFL